MSRFVDLTGKQFGKWTVIENAGTRTRHWKCRCICGIVKLVYGSHLVGGRSKACHHCASPNMLPKGESAFKRLYKWYQRNARVRNHEWNLSSEEARKLFQRNCFYCDSVPTNISAPNPRGNGSFLYNGIDRVNNLLGYTIENSITACEICNFMKRNLSLEAFNTHIRKIYRHSMATKIETA